MRLHRNLADAVVETLSDIFNGGVYADKAVESRLKSNKRWGSRDRAFIAETVYDIVRWKRLYAEAIEASSPLEKTDLFKLLFVCLSTKDYEMPDWEEFEGLVPSEIARRISELSKTRSLRESIPEWLDKKGEGELGEQLWSKEIRALNDPAAVVLRTNTLKTSRLKLQSGLAAQSIDTLPLDKYPEALVLRKRSNVMGSHLFKQGFFEIQDASSQRVAHFAQLRPGMTVVDACAGAGGKSLHMACLMENHGRIIAMDIHGYKLKELQRRARRNGISIIETRRIRSEKDISDLHHLADVVLIDAPCSGLGVLRRNPDAKWKLTDKFIARCIGLQKKLLAAYTRMVKPGGKLVYATCSILPSENKEQIEWFLDSGNGQDFILEEQQEIWASESGFDGFFMARLGRSN